MKAIIYNKYGSPDVLKLQEVEKPTPKDDELLIKIMATSLNASDWEFLTARPAYVRLWGLFKPKKNILGSDITGQVAGIGKNVTQFRLGDEVFGDLLMHWGGFAEYACVPQREMMTKPASMTFEQIAALPQASTIALQGLRDKGQIKPGQKVLINGAGGGAGSFAIQLAKFFGAEVTAVDHGEKFDVMRKLGADHVIDYSKEDYSRKGQSYDLILDLVAHRSIFDNKGALSSGGRYVLVGGSVPSILQLLFLGPWISIFTDKKMGILSHRQNKKDLDFMIRLFDAGKVVPVIDKCYPLPQVPEALRYLGAGSAKGKIVITVWA